MENRGAIIVGLVIILLGTFLLVTHFFPEPFSLFEGYFTVIMIGAAFLVAAVLTRRSGLAIPGCIIGGIGTILYLQEQSGDFMSWTYAWTLVPGFVGLGIIISGLLDRDHPHFDSGALVIIAISAAAFLLFSGLLGTTWDWETYWPVLLIAAGVMVLVSAIFRKK